MRNYCTLFDTGYLSRGVVLHDSLLATGDDFQLYVFCMDDTVYRVLKALNRKRLVPIKLADFESPDLLRVKPTRTSGEYCWTCTSQVIHYALNRFSLPEITYLDADMFFYASPAPLLEEFYQSGASVLITSHRYTRRYDISWRSGIYCVQFITFRADPRGFQALDWWRERCLEWCYARVEDGKFGDQRYLDDWPQRFAGIHVLKHLGGGVAPWNVQQYAISRMNDSYQGRERRTGNAFNLIFFHFHNVRFLSNDWVDLGDYHLVSDLKHSLFFPYLLALDRVGVEIAAIDPAIDPHGKRPLSTSFLHRALRFRRRLLHNYLPFDAIRRL